MILITSFSLLYFKNKRYIFSMSRSCGVSILA
nr:MAG TPA: hypothetical protein [Caudoviricetes sp.]